MHDAVPHTTELDRVLTIPRRDWQDGSEGFAAALTDTLRTQRACAECGGQRAHAHGCKRKRIPLSLRPHQALALFDFYQNQGLLAPIGVGQGKTLIHLLLARVTGSMRPLLVLQGGLIGKTRREWLDLAVYWQIPNWLKLISYEVLGRVSGKDELERFQPDVIAFDEVHRIKNPKAAVTRRVVTYVDHHRYHDTKKRNCRLCDEKIPPRALIAQGGRTRLRLAGMSGTITSKTPKDFAHIMHMCLPEHTTVPNSWHELDMWHRALAQNVHEMSRLAPGALLQFCANDDWKGSTPDSVVDPLTAARRGFARRLRQTPGVVATTDAGIGTSLQIFAREAPASPAIEAAMSKLRGWELPDGHQCVDGVEVYRHALELSLGFYYVWDPRPPQDWLEARSFWGTFVRSVIRGGKYDSEQDVALHAHKFTTTVDNVIQWRNPDRDPAVLLRHPNPEIGRRHVYDHWVATRDQPREGGKPFKINKVPVWICDSALKDAASWLDAHPRGIVWTDCIAFGHALERYSGKSYFAEGGLDRKGRALEQVTGPVIAALDANKTGRNLQFNWSDNLFMCPMGDGAEFEQAQARTHRDGQEEDTVTTELWLGCLEHAAAFAICRERAGYLEDLTTQAQKLNFADVTFPAVSEIAARKGARWEKEYRAT